MPIFDSDSTPGFWLPSPLAAGPFSGLQGGAIAGLLIAEVEARAAERRWGSAISVSVAFLKSTPMARLRSSISVLREGGRVSFVDNTLFAEGDSEPCATARITLINERSVAAPPLPERRTETADPTRFPVRKVASFHGRPWMMDAMEARAGDGIAWFRQHVPMIADAPAHTLSSVVGAADWAHGIARPLQNALADPNPNLTVHLLRPRQGDWVGIRAHTSWDTQRGLGIGGGAVLDVHGEIGSVSMAVALVPLPKQAPTRAADRETA